MFSFRTIDKGWCKMFFIGLESGQYDADDIKWSRVSSSEYQVVVDIHTKTKSSLRIKTSEGLNVIVFALFALSVISGLISLVLWIARENATSPLQATAMSLLAAIVAFGVSRLPLLTKPHKRLANARRSLASVTMCVPNDVIDVARVHCEKYQKTDLLDILEASGLDVDSYREHSSDDQFSYTWLTLNWLQAYPLLFYHLLIDLQEEVYRTNFLYIDVDEKSREEIIAASIDQIDSAHTKALRRIQPK